MTCQWVQPFRLGISAFKEENFATMLMQQAQLKREIIMRTSIRTNLLNMALENPTRTTPTPMLRYDNPDMVRVHIAQTEVRNLYRLLKLRK